jgi:eukaryotic-like serine/threonine-protein kinase
LRAGRLGYGVVLALTVVLAASAGYFAAARMRPPAPAPSTTALLAVDSAPAGLEVFIDGVPRGVTPVRLELEPGPARLEIDTPVGRRGLALDLRAGAESSHHFDVEAPPDRPAPMAAGSLEVRSDPPGATVVVGGRQRGVTPLTIADLGPGVHDVLLGHGGRSRLERVTVSAGRTSTISVAFAAAVPSRAEGTLRVQAPIALQIFRGDRAAGSTARPLSLPAGPHELDFVNEQVGFRSTVRVTVGEGQVTNLRVEVPPGRLSINATPWAEVWLGDRKLGDTPLANVALPAGEHEFIFRNPELGERRRSAVVPSGATGRLTMDFRE